MAPGAARSVGAYCGPFRKPIDGHRHTAPSAVRRCTVLYMTDGSEDSSGAREVSVTDARSNLADLIDAVRDGEFIYLVRHGERVAALMPADIAEHYEQIEDDYWARRADDARRAIAEGEEDTVSWQQYLAGSA